MNYLVGSPAYAQNRANSVLYDYMYIEAVDTYTLYNISKHTGDKRIT